MEVRDGSSTPLRLAGGAQTPPRHLTARLSPPPGSSPLSRSPMHALSSSPSPNLQAAGASSLAASIVPPRHRQPATVPEDEVVENEHVTPQRWALGLGAPKQGLPPTPELPGVARVGCPSG